MLDCPKCGLPMVLRNATRGRNRGKSFYGCINYPHCKMTVNIEQVQAIQDEKLIKDGKDLIRRLRYEGFRLLEKVSVFHPKYNIIKNALPNLKKEVNEKNYNRGNKLFRENKWNEAIMALEQIPINSKLYNKVKVTIKIARDRRPMIAHDRSTYNKHNNPKIKYNLDQHGDVVNICFN
ncbi:MAG: topoisomerase DNA-binding C4 zinc finger domain-containing protein [Patescibacteria group bacterium]|nr:topoisomerase DNA-binding C4 zinc finger domain-containing protein [Patescibacteria group bacterium]